MSTFSTQDWTPTSEKLPPEKTEVLAMDSGGHVQTLIREGPLWWLKDMSMYVYYVPKFWRLP